jgi:hypothetical protein
VIIETRLITNQDLTPYLFQRTVALARSIICCVAVDQLMLSGTFVANRLNLTPSAVSKLVSRGRLETKTREITKELPEVK